MMKYKTIKWAAGLAICVTSLWAAGSAHGVSIYLRAEKAELTLPDGKSVEMWGFIQDVDADFTTFETTAGYGFQGSAIKIPSNASGNSLIIHILNRLDVPVSAVIPGQNGYVLGQAHGTFLDAQGRTRARSFVKEVPPQLDPAVEDQVGTYVWQNSTPGTYLLYSGSHSAVQVQMGLYMPVIREVANNSPYPGYSVSSQRQLTLLFSEIDPDVHDAVASGEYGTAMTSTIRSKAKYYLINGKAFSLDTPPPAINIPGNANAPVLLRLLNAGIDYHVPTLNGLHVNVIAESGRLYPYPREESAVALAALQTRDAIVTPPQGLLPLYDRRLGLSNGTQSPGGMLVYLDN